MDSLNSTITVRFEDDKVAISEIVDKLLERKFKVVEMVEVPTEEGKPIKESDPGAHPPAPPSE